LHNPRLNTPGRFNITLNPTANLSVEPGQSRTTKLNNGKIRRTKWVTTQAGYRAAEVARKIAQFIYSEVGVVPVESEGLLPKYPLFVNIAHLGFGHRKREVDHHVIATSELSAAEKGLARIRETLFPTITNEDLIELESIDPHRAWRSEMEFQLGTPWPFATHQLRRSLVLYAQRSGLVSLPSLKRQLQHITVEMSQWYVKGAAFAINFVDDDPDSYKMHVAHDWRVAKPESEALAFLRDVVFSEEELFGGAGSFEQGKKDRGEFVDREVTIARFRRGEVAYRETPLGGCTKIGQCDQVGLKIVDTACLRGCQNMVGKMSRLDSVIKRQESLVSALSPDTVEFRMENSDLQALRSAREQWQASSTRRRNVQRTR
jgi:hypothetical protein